MDASTLRFIMKLGALLGKGPCIPVPGGARSTSILSGSVVLMLGAWLDGIPDMVVTSCVDVPAPGDVLN